jgi:ABC-type methionine transport system ATPase subunit
MPLEYLGGEPREIKARVGELLERVGLGHRAGHYPHQLSGGQRQRVGIARALALRPSVLLSDEATSGLDPETTRSVVSLLRELRDDLDLAVVFITHEMDTVLQVADSAAKLEHGRIVESGRLVDLLTDHDSALGRALQPHLAPAAPAEGARPWQVTYDSQAVPQDWLQRISQELGEPASLLAATIQTVNGVSTGKATVGLRAGSPDLVRDAFARLGLRADPVSTLSGSGRQDPAREDAPATLEHAL